MADHPRQEHTRPAAESSARRRQNQETPRESDKRQGKRKIDEQSGKRHILHDAASSETASGGIEAERPSSGCTRNVVDEQRDPQDCYRHQLTCPETESHYAEADRERCDDPETAKRDDVDPVCSPKLRV